MRARCGCSPARQGRGQIQTCESPARIQKASFRSGRRRGCLSTRQTHASPCSRAALLCAPRSGCGARCPPATWPPTRRARSAAPRRRWDCARRWRRSPSARRLGPAARGSQWAALSCRRRNAQVPTPRRGYSPIIRRFVKTT